ncbi:GTP-binding protein (plasmid) [Tistrella mobilis]|uniref:CobW family GTP-binding protein n=1 Tax=Tistrella mobilis TaxID=171437 RepID=UPI003557D898
MTTAPATAPVPVLVVTGYLGAGKTTLINSLLADAGGRRIAAIVNDFGAINIDEELIRARTDTVVGLANGCVCCTLQGDLLRTLKLLLARDPSPDHIIVEASGVADPAGIIQALSDPVLWKSTRLDAVLCVVDAEDLVASPARRADPLWQAQLAAASFVVLAKAGGLDARAAADLARSLSPRGKPPVIDTAREPLPVALLLDGGPDLPALPGRRFTATAATGESHAGSRFATTTWQSAGPVSLVALQALIGALAPVLVRAKGIFRFTEKPGQTWLLQMVGQRVTLAPLSGDYPEGCRLVLIAEAGRLDGAAIAAQLAPQTPL